MSAESTQPLVGVLAVQGDFAEHQAALGRAGVATRQVRVPRDLDGVDGLVLPGGESTTMLKLLELQELSGPLLDHIESGLPVLATCAGLILLATEVVDPQQRGLAVLDVTVARNGYGRQIHSGTFSLQVQGLEDVGAATGTFIRAPRVLRVGADIEVLARWHDDPVLLRRGPILAACFHPELQPQHFVTEMFSRSVRLRRSRCRLSADSILHSESHDA